MKISFVILSIGDKEEKLKLCINSIHRNFLNKDDYEIVLVGNNIDFIHDDSVTKIIDEEFVEFLGKRKNIGTENSQGDILVHCDDDIIFPADWYVNFKRYNNKENSWRILGHKILLPDGNRHWDRATFLPIHRMVPYNYTSKSDTFYQTGGFSICKKDLLKEVSWDNNIPFYGMFKGFQHNEDIDFSLRLKEKGIDIFFDPNNTVWHYDFSYHSDNITCNKKKKIGDIQYKHIDFILAMDSLQKIKNK